MAHACPCSSGSPAVGELPSYPEVIARTERITKRIQELLLSAREGRRECFLPCTENILQAGVFAPGCDRSPPKDRTRGGLGSSSSLREAMGFQVKSSCVVHMFRQPEVSQPRWVAAVSAEDKKCSRCRTTAGLRSLTCPTWW